MRLLDTTTLTLGEFLSDSIPQYVILSHRWEDEEVSFQDLQSGRGLGMKGYTRSKDAVRRLLWTAGIMLGWIPAVSTRRAAPSYLRLSILCSSGIRRPRCVMCTCLM